MSAASSNVITIRPSFWYAADASIIGTYTCRNRSALTSPPVLLAVHVDAGARRVVPVVAEVRGDEVEVRRVRGGEVLGQPVDARQARVRDERADVLLARRRRLARRHVHDRVEVHERVVPRGVLVRGRRVPACRPGCLAGWSSPPSPGPSPPAGRSRGLPRREACAVHGVAHVLHVAMPGLAGDAQLVGEGSTCVVELSGYTQPEPAGTPPAVTVPTKSWYTWQSENVDGFPTARTAARGNCPGSRARSRSSSAGTRRTARACRGGTTRPRTPPTRSRSRAGSATRARSPGRSWRRSASPARATTWSPTASTPATAAEDAHTPHDGASVPIRSVVASRARRRYWRASAARPAVPAIVATERAGAGRSGSWAGGCGLGGAGAVR